MVLSEGEQYERRAMTYMDGNPILVEDIYPDRETKRKLMAVVGAYLPMEKRVVFHDSQGGRTVPKVEYFPDKQAKDCSKGPKSGAKRKPQTPITVPGVKRQGPLLHILRLTRTSSHSLHARFTGGH